MLHATRSACTPFHGDANGLESPDSSRAVLRQSASPVRDSALAVYHLLSIALPRSTLLLPLHPFVLDHQFFARFTKSRSFSHGTLPRRRAHTVSIGCSQPLPPT